MSECGLITDGDAPSIGLAQNDLKPIALVGDQNIDINPEFMKIVSNPQALEGGMERT